MLNEAVDEYLKKLRCKIFSYQKQKIASQFLKIIYKMSKIYFRKAHDEKTSGLIVLINSQNFSSCVLLK